MEDRQPTVPSEDRFNVKDESDYDRPRFIDFGNSFLIEHDYEYDPFADTDDVSVDANDEVTVDVDCDGDEYV
jgi:hypothetical protein